jgi:hypothetical protein
MAKSNKTTKSKKTDSVVKNEANTVSETENEYLDMMKDISTEDVDNMKKDIVIDDNEISYETPTVDVNENEEKDVSEVEEAENVVSTETVVDNNIEKETSLTVKKTTDNEENMVEDGSDDNKAETTTSIHIDDDKSKCNKQEEKVVEDKKEAKRRRTTREMFGCDWLGVIYDM